jgi:hypothetical protein
MKQLFSLLCQAYLVLARAASLREAQNVLLVVAHRIAKVASSKWKLMWLAADDEALFFAPTIIKLQQAGKTGHILSLSNGALSRDVRAVETNFS